MNATRARVAAALGVVALVVVPATGAGAQTYGGGSETGSSKSTSVNVEPPATTAKPSDPGGTLPFTGADVAGLSLAAGAAIAGGFALTRAHRRRVAA